jgi:hypothetical protein
MSRSINETTVTVTKAATTIRPTFSLAELVSASPPLPTYHGSTLSPLDDSPIQAIRRGTPGASQMGDSHNHGRPPAIPTGSCRPLISIRGEGVDLVVIVAALLLLRPLDLGLLSSLRLL